VPPCLLWNALCRAFDPWKAKDDRRDAIKCMIWAGTGVIDTSGGGLKSSQPRHRRRVVGAGVRPKRANLSEDVMTICKNWDPIFQAWLPGATLAGDISKNLANSKQVANVKGDKLPPKRAAASVVAHHAGPQAPIVMGRSVSLHHKTKLHHVKIKPVDSNENLTSADGSQ
jgi:hypothetical protein